MAYVCFDRADEKGRPLPGCVSRRERVPDRVHLDGISHGRAGAVALDVVGPGEV